MAHAVYTRNLGRSRSWRKATVRSLAQAALREERIQTTRARAKEAQRLVERLITLGKRGTLAARRRALGTLGDSRLVHRLFSEIAPRFRNRSGGYTRIVQNGFRAGDGASMAILELVELSPERTRPKPKAQTERPKAVPTEAPPKPKPERKAPEPKPKAAGPPVSPAPSRGAQAPQEKPKPRGFIEGLRKFFKRRQNP